jgi:multicomponent Na+:H+ antiporter subunit G
VTVLDVLAAVLILGGVVLALIAAIGLHRFPDVFARMHAASKPATLGLVLVLVGASLRMTNVGDIGKLLLVAMLQFLTVPVGAHLVARAAYHAGTELAPDTVVDELATVNTTGEPADSPGDATP